MCSYEDATIRDYTAARNTNDDLIDANEVDDGGRSDAEGDG
jgi:hypothetical protein